MADTEPTVHAEPTVPVVVDSTTANPTDIFTQSNITAIMWFLAIYFIIVLFLAVFFRDTLISMQIFTGRVIDVILFASGVYYAFYSYYNLTEEERGDPVAYIQTHLRSSLDNINTMVYTGILLVAVTLFSYVFNTLTMSSESPTSISIISGFAWIYMIILAIYNFAKYFLHVSLTDLFPDTVVPTDDVSVVATGGGSEVFNVSNNLYSYEHAQEVCSSFGARLATYDEIESAYNHGAEWCNYGWSDGQMAYFPTQKETWSVLQKNKEHANDCGRPGINGGHIVNKNVRFGANCYGKKPAPKESDLTRMAALKTSAIPVTNMEQQTQQKVNAWDSATINSYNRDKWSST